MKNKMLKQYLTVLIIYFGVIVNVTATNDQPSDHPSFVELTVSKPLNPGDCVGLMLCKLYRHNAN